MKYPVFAFQENDNMIYVYFKEHNLKSTSIEILESLGFSGITIVDSNGIIYKIKRAKKIKYIGLYGFSLFKKGRQILVDFEFEDKKSSIELDKFKKDILEKIETNKKFWQSTWDNISESEEKIKKSTSFEDIARLLN